MGCDLYAEVDYARFLDWLDKHKVKLAKEFVEDIMPDDFADFCEKKYGEEK